MTTAAYQPRALEAPVARAHKLAFLPRLYAWSVVFETFLLFVLFDATTTGVTGNVSKMLQTIVVMALLARLLARAVGFGLGTIRVVDLSNPLFRHFRNYFLLALIAGAIGAMSGAYRVPAEFNVIYTETTAVSSIMNASYTRPVIEYLILLYYFVYFVVLPKYLLNDRPKIEYFLRLFRTLFIVSFALGIVDFLLWHATGVTAIPRHISDEIWVSSGGRYHGLWGEPRDAFVYLFLGLALLHLDAYYRGTRLSRWWVVGIISAAIATQSTSGLVGIAVFILLYSLYGLSNLSKRRFVLLAIVYVIAPVLVYAAVASSENIQRYLEALYGVWDVLESGKEIPFLLSVQMVNIYPLYDLTVKFRNSELLPLVIGSGLGSASAINNFIPGIPFSAVANPHSQIVRVIYESGIIGLYLYAAAFTYPVIHLTRRLPAKVRNHFVLLAFLVLGCAFGQRSSAGFIYLGIFIVVFHVMSQNGRAPRGR